MEHSPLKQPIAELWFGTHPSGQSVIVVNNQLVPMDQFLRRYPEMIGDVTIYSKYRTIPFLFKVLTVAKPLSLQAHPDRELAKILHKDDPKNYPDSNHKPELAIALTDFHVLCDFRPVKELADFMKNISPLQRLLSKEICDSLLKSIGDPTRERVSLSKCFRVLMTCSPVSINHETEKFLNEYKDSEKVSKQIYSLIKRIALLYPGDPGVFSPLFLNYIHMKPGQAIYLRANKLHAYIDGDCVECMTCSDNVVRAGLTRKFCDVNTLTKMLDYNCVNSAKDILLQAKIQNIPDGPSIASYDPTEEFKVDEIKVNENSTLNGKCKIPPKTGGSFFVVVSGQARAKDFFDTSIEHKLQFGSSGFIPPKVELDLTNIKGTLLMYRSYC